MGISGRTSIAGLVLCISATAQVSGEREQYSKREQYSNDIRQNYSFHFGKDQISTPGNAAIEGNDFIPPTAFPKAEYCGKCHQEAYSQWRQALHSNSFRTPFYRTSVNILLRTRGIEFTRHCDSCHNPIGVLSGALTPDSKVDRAFDADGLTCMTCHAVQALQATTGNGGFVMGVPYVTTDEKGNPVHQQRITWRQLNQNLRHSLDQFVLE